MKKLIMAVVFGLILVGCGKEQAGIGIKYSELVDGISIPMKEVQNEIDGKAMSGFVRNQDGGLITLYTALNGDAVTKARLVIMPSQQGNLPSDAKNLQTMLRALHNIAPGWSERQDWFANAAQRAHATPNVIVTGAYGGNRFSLIEVPELRSFELEIVKGKS